MEKMDWRYHGEGAVNIVFSNGKQALRINKNYVADAKMTDCTANQQKQRNACVLPLFENFAL